ncbi:hypothetical protein B0H17DRAFT_111065 [Mycena rosella]|uniref:Uncharacterized protein n=1 Tax=Mycena rosella TaxID=1033263 RepID=A0AAD7GD07_MYCRO|nr:hypothetical protein B0H17DRAFT_111065 [Mycena rosella]
MLSSFSNFLPTALYTPPPLKADHIRLDEDDDDDDPSLKSDANPDKSHEMGVPVKNKSVNETFIFVRPPPAKSNHPLNLQVQLVPPKSRLPLGHTSALRQSLDMNASPPTTPVDSAPTTPDASYDWGAPLAPTMTSHSAASTYSGTTLVGARSTASIYSTATLVAPASTRRMIIPLYNLQAHNVMANIIVDAGTDAKVARFTKRGLEMIDLAVLEPVEVYPGAGSPTGDAPLRQSSSFSNRTVGGRPSISGSLGSRSSGRIDPTNASEAPLTPSSVRSQSQNEALPTPTRERFSEVAGAQATLPQQRNIFGKLFKKKDPGVPDSETPTLGGEDAAPGAIADLRTPVLGLTASVSSPVHPPKGRPGLYVWVVKRWLKDEGGLLAMAKGMVKGQGGYGELAAEVELRFEWKRGKAKRRTDTEKEEKRANLRSSQASVPAAQTEEDSGEESDPEDSETPWMCTVKVRQLVAHSQRALPLGREGRGGRNRERETDEAQGKKEMVRIKVGTLSPTPHHPKVVAMLKVPFPLPDVDVEQMVVHKREPSGARPGGARVILAEEIKDVVCSTGLWLAVRESFGGLGKVARKGDGWRIRGSYAQKQSDQSPPSPNLKHSLMSDDYGIRHVLPLLPPLTVPSPAPVVKFRDLPPSIHPLRVPSPATVQLLPPGSLLAENVTFPQGPLETRGDDGESNGAGGNGENNLFDLASDSTSPNAASSHSNPLGSKIMDAHPDGAPTTSSIPRGIYQEHREEDLNYLGPDKASVSSPVDPHSAVVLHSDPFGFRSPTADNQSDVSLTTSSIAKATDEDGARGDLVFRNETQIATFVIYIPDTLSTPTNDPTAIRPGDVRILEEHVPEGGNAVLAHMPTEPEDWVELHYDSALLNTIRSVGLGGPIPTMLSPETPALAIFGSILDDQVLELAKTLSDVSAFAVMVRSTEDDPLVKFMQAREIDIEMYPESGYSSEGSDNGTTGDDIESDADDSHSDSGDDYGIGGTFRPRGGALRKGKQKEVDPDYIIPAGIDRPDGFHCTRVKLHLQLHQDCLYDVAISSKTAFKFQTEKGETPHTLTEPISRPQVLSCVDLKVETRPFEVLLDRSYSNLGFIVHRQKSIAGREYLPRGFEPPSATATRSTQKSTENKGSLTFGLDSMQPVVTAKVSHGRTTGETVQLADDKACLSL